MNYLNEFEPSAAAWLRDLRDAGHIPPCVIDTRSIEDVHPSDLHGFTQCHFFAGIGGWPLALALAGWPTDRPVWTGSCPCQPFSAAGAGAGFADERHLWPAFHWLIQECRPAVVFGEQVASAAVGPWLDLVLTDLEALGYSGGAIAFPAAGIGAPHIRDRTYWVGHAIGEGSQEQRRRRDEPARLAASRPAVRLADTDCGAGEQGSQDVRGRPGGSDAQPRARLGCGGMPIGLADADGERCDGLDTLLQREESGRIAGHRLEADGRGPLAGHWRSADWLRCRDDRWRAVEPGTFPLAHGLPARVGRLRGYGNAIVPQAAAEFIRAFEESRLGRRAA